MRMYLYSTLVFALLAPPLLPVGADYPFRNTSLPWGERVDDLVGRLTVEEMMMQMAMGGHGKWSPTPAIPRLGIKTFKWNGECERGANGVPNATAFVQGIGLAASFSPGLVESVMTAVATEYRAYYNFIAASNTSLWGTNCYSTTFNILRDPRWGRAQETLGEDPYLTGRLCESYVTGAQGTDKRFFRVSIGAKHFDAYGGPDDKPISRVKFDAKVSERDLRTTFMAQFRRCAAAGVGGIMCTYTSLNGVPTCASKFLQTDVLRTEWKYPGYTVSDAGAVYGVEAHHNYTHNDVDTAAACVNAGLNLEDASLAVSSPPYLSIAKAVQQGKIKESTLRDGVKPLFYTRMRLGEFDPPYDNPYNDIPVQVIGQPQHLDLAVQAAIDSFVLLKNDGVLPLPRETYKKIAVVGPLADNITELFGNYHSPIVPDYCSTPLEGLRQVGDTVNYASGCNNNVCDQYDQQSVLEAIQGVHYIFLCLGTGPAVEEEGNDRTELDLPGQQGDLLLDVINNKKGAKIVLLLFNGGPVNISLADSRPEVSAIMDCFLPAQAGGEAIRRVVTMEDAVPGGRSPYTWPLYLDQVPPMTDYRMTGRTYRYWEGDSLYPFGYGLSYTSFSYSNLSFPMGSTVQAGHNLIGLVLVHNTGDIKADEVVQIYISWDGASVDTQKLQLVSFERLTIPGDAAWMYQFTLTPDQMAVWVDNKGWLVEPGRLTVYAGGQQPGQKKRAPSNVLSAKVTITGSSYLGKF